MADQPRAQTHFYGDGCSAPHGSACAHDSLSGVDQDDGPNKLWRCDVCQVVLRPITVLGITHYEEVH